MSIFGSLQLAGNTLQAMQIGLHVVGNNIANANTPGFIREKAVFATAPTQRIGNLTLGLGVEVAGIVQQVDKFVEQRLRDAGGDRASADVQDKVYGDLEAILGELTDVDISSAMTNFFNNVNKVVETPEDISIRNLAIQSGKTLTTNINTLNRRVETLHRDFSQQVDNLTVEINTLTEQVRELNLQIVNLEGGGVTGSEAGSLRSQRNEAIKRLAEVAGVDAIETDTGNVNLILGSDFLLFEGNRREVSTVLSVQGGRAIRTAQYTDNEGLVRVASGELHGIYSARDDIVGQFLDRLDDFAATLASEFNQVFAQGQGITGFSQVTSVNGVDDASATLDEAGLPFTPVNGSFDVRVYNKLTGLFEPTTVLVDLNGVDGDDTLASLATKLDAINGVSAAVNFDNQLVIEAESEDGEIAFDGDTSGLLAALGVNTFFTGSRASDLGVNSVLLEDGSKFAAAIDGLGVGIENAQRLVELHDTALDSLNGGSISGLYDQLINETTQGATVAKSIADGLNVFEQTLLASAQAVSGVNLDEEAIDMILLQRTYQASARYIATLSELLDIVVNL